MKWHLLLSVLIGVVNFLISMNFEEKTISKDRDIFLGTLLLILVIWSVLPSPKEVSGVAPCHL